LGTPDVRCGSYNNVAKTIMANVVDEKHKEKRVCSKMTMFRDGDKRVSFAELLHLGPSAKS